MAMKNGSAAKPPRHKWELRDGDYRASPPTAVERCKWCGVLTKKQVVKTSRIGVRTASFSWVDTPVYSRDGESWQWTKPVCTGKPATAPTVPA